MCLPLSGAVAVQDGSIYADTSRDVFLLAPNCQGNESSLAECSRQTSSSCVTQRDVGVVCQGNYYYVCYPERRGCGVSR